MAMVRSTFAGFTTAQLALAASQRSIDAAGQNISNVNTEGYTRQRIDLASISPTGFSYAMMQNSILVGQGVQMTNIIQIRDPFLDVQYRHQLAKVGTIDAQDATLTDIGAIFDEVDKTAVYAALNDVISQLNIMANPDSSNQGASDTLVRSAMETLLNVIHENATALDDVYADKLAKLEDTDIPSINEIIKSIATLNGSIKNTHILGGAALELMDQRNALIDELATYLPINVTYRDLNLGAGIVVDVMELSFTDTDGNKHILINDEKTGFEEDANGNITREPFVYEAPSDANGYRAGLKINCLDGYDTETREVVDAGGNIVTETIKVPNGEATTYTIIGMVEEVDNTGAATRQQVFRDALGDGVLRGTYDSVNKSGTLDYPPTDFKGIGFYQKAYDSFVHTFASKLNELNIAANGKALFTNLDDDYAYNKDAAGNVTTAEDFRFTASNIKVSDEWMSGNAWIMTVQGMGDTDTGNINVLKMINAISTDVQEFTVVDKEGNVIRSDTDSDNDGFNDPILAFRGNCFDAYNNLQITQAIDQKATNSILQTRTAVLNDIADSKDSVSGVWMDEEVMDLMQFSHSYNAAAQLMTTLDEMLVTLLGIKR